jgi:tetratricopeptide (TPR) repeat protein
MTRAGLVLAVIVCAFLAAMADEGQHHEDLTPQQVGTVHFPVSCSAAVQKPFERGVALLHSFWYEEAQKEFEDIARQDPECAMAEWGIAMSLWHQLWNHPDATTIKNANEALNKGKELKPKTQRERDYIDAIAAFYHDSDHLDYEQRATAYSNAMERMYKKYPDDREAAAFYALSLLASEPDDDPGYVNRKKAAAVLEKLFDVEPDHPGIAHYLIHSYDKPELAQLGLPAARRYAKIAPAAPHALHMPSHIFARLGLWQDDIDSNLASIAATRKTAAMHMGGEGHQFHAMDFLVYAYLQCGRDGDARRVIDEVKAMPQMHDMYGMGYDQHISALVALEAAYALERRQWAEAAQLEPVTGADPGDSSITYWARGMGAARSGDLDGARKDLAEIESLHKKQMERKKKTSADAVDRDRQEVQAWIEHAQGNNTQAIALLRPIAEKDYGVSDVSDQIPASEMLGDMLLDMKKPEEALSEYEADLKVNPNRLNGLRGAAQAAALAGKGEQASQYRAELQKLCAGSHSDRCQIEQSHSAPGK